VVQKFARERDKLDSEQWEKIAFMAVRSPLRTPCLRKRLRTAISRTAPESTPNKS